MVGSSQGAEVGCAEPQVGLGPRSLVSRRSQRSSETAPHPRWGISRLAFAPPQSLRGSDRNRGQKGLLLKNPLLAEEPAILFALALFSIVALLINRIPAGRKTLKGSQTYFGLPARNNSLHRLGLLPRAKEASSPKCSIVVNTMEKTALPEFSISGFGSVSFSGSRTSELQTPLAAPTTNRLQIAGSRSFDSCQLLSARVSVRVPWRSNSRVPVYRWSYSAISGEAERATARSDRSAHRSAFGAV